MLASSVSARRGRGLDWFSALESTPEVALGGQSRDAAAKSETGLEEALSFLGPALDAAEPWAERLEELMAVVIAAFVERRTLSTTVTGRVPPPVDLVTRAATRLTACARPLVAESIRTARGTVADGVRVHLWDSNLLLADIGGLDSRFGWPEPVRTEQEADAAADRRLLESLRDFVAAEVLANGVT